MGTKRCQGESCYGLASCSTWSVCVSVCTYETSFMYVCQTTLCMYVRLYLYMCVRLYLCMCVRLHLCLCVTTTLSNEEITKIKVVDLDEFKNFYIHDFVLV